MARYTGPVCRLCRRDGQKLFLKGAKCFGDKCPVDKRNFPPGQHGQSKKIKKLIGYGLQLREKQKAKRIYFTLETQFNGSLLTSKALTRPASPANCSCSSSKRAWTMSAIASVLP